MKCPRCGLVHAPLEQVCRRCEIDLRTGEPRGRAAARIETTLNAPSSLQRLRERLKPVTRPPATPQPAATDAHPAPGKEPHAAPAKTKPAAFVAYAMSKKSSLPRVLRRFKLEPAVKSITCVQCSNEMAIARTASFPRSGPIALIVLGAALLIAGIFLRLLLITGAASLALAVFYLRAGRTSWKCPSCGLTIPRAP